jgi:hypothetical protein
MAKPLTATERKKLAEANSKLLRSAMRRAKISTINELARLSGVAPSILYRFDQGIVQMFSPKTQLKLEPVLPALFRKPMLLSDEEFEVEAEPFRRSFAKTLEGQGSTKRLRDGTKR